MTFSSILYDALSRVGTKILVALFAGIVLAGCSGFEDELFPIWEPNFFEESPAEVGPFDVVERRITVRDGADGEPFGITFFEPKDAAGPLPVFMWFQCTSLLSPESA